MISEGKEQGLCVKGAFIVADGDGVEPSVDSPCSLAQRSCVEFECRV